MSVETTEIDPFDVEPPAEDSIPEDAFDGSLDSEFDDLFASLDDMEEEESGEDIQVRAQVKTYRNPYDVGLKDMQWVPIKILSAEVDPKHVPRLSSEVIIAKKTLEDDTVKTYALYDQVEAAVKAGAQEIKGKIPLPHFVATANHASDKFQRGFDYEIEVPVFTIKTAYFKPQRSGKTGFANEMGRSLRKATGATGEGDKVTPQNMAEVASRMVETIVMAQLSIVQSKKPKRRDILDANGQQIMVLLNPEDGTLVAIRALEDGSGYVNDASGEIWEGDEALLFKVAENLYAILDSGESSGPLDEEYYPINDYLNSKSPFLPVPDRKAEVERIDGSTVEGEITMDTVGAIVPSKPLGGEVDVFLPSTGEIISARWVGTQWIEKPSKSDGDDADHFSGAGAGIDSL